MDRDDKLLAAYQVECVEHLEGIRAGLGKLAEGGRRRSGEELDDAFRRAHSLKGAARLVGATVAESIAHRLESLFSRLRSGATCCDKDIFDLVQLALNAIEDSTATATEDTLPGEVQRVLHELDQLGAGASAAHVLAAQPPTLEERLRAAFQEEHHGYLAGITALVEEFGQSGNASSAVLDEAFRCAHSLKGAARVANIHGVDNIAESLDRVLSRVRRGRVALERALISDVGCALQTLVDCMTAPARAGEQEVDDMVARLDRWAGADAEGQKPMDQTPLAGATPAGGAVPAKSAEPPTAPLETVRLNAENLDRLIESSGELLSEGLKQDLVAQELAALNRQIAVLDSQWQTVKNAAGAARNLPANADCSRIVRAIDLVDHQLHTISRHARSLRLLQKQSAWSLRLAGDQLQRDVRRTRMLPAECVFQGFRKLVRDLARDEGKQVDFRVEGFEVEADRAVLQALKDPLMHALRNAVSHGIEPPQERQNRGKPATGSVSLAVETEGNRLTIVVEDDGRGIDLARTAQIASRRQLLPAGEAATASAQELTRVLFQPGVSTATAVTELSGRGIGLSVVHEAVTRLQGEVELRPGESGGAVLWLSVPLAVSTHRLLLASCCGQTFAIPLYGIACLERLRRSDVVSIEGRPMVLVDGQLTPLATLAQLIDVHDENAGGETAPLSVIILQSGRKRVAVTVDALLAERDALIKSLGPPLESLSKFSGGILLEDGTVALVLNPAELVQSFRPSQRAPLQAVKAGQAKQPPSILVVDDSFTTRTLETSILETHGYRVRVAVDGIEALAQLRSEKADLVITDIQMPRLDGFGLLEEIRNDSRLSGTPVIVVSSVDQRDDQQRGLDLGADAYIVKRKFDHQELLQTIEQIL